MAWVNRVMSLSWDSSIVARSPESGVEIGLTIQTQTTTPLPWISGTRFSFAFTASVFHAFLSFGIFCRFNAVNFFRVLSRRRLHRPLHTRDLAAKALGRDSYELHQLGLGNRGVLPSCLRLYWLVWKEVHRQCLPLPRRRARTGHVCWSCDPGRNRNRHDYVHVQRRTRLQVRFLSVRGCPDLRFGHDRRRPHWL